MAKYDKWLEEDGLTLVKGWARDGLTDRQIAKNMGIAYSTLRLWCKQFSALSATLKKGKEVIDFEVENALLKRAIGYRYTEKTKELVEGELIVTKEVEKELPPDVGALAFWLKNRKREKWRDRWENAPEESEESGVVIMPEVDADE